MAGITRSKIEKRATILHHSVELEVTHGWYYKILHRKKSYNNTPFSRSDPWLVLQDLTKKEELQ